MVRTLARQGAIQLSTSMAEAGMALRQGILLVALRAMAVRLSLPLLRLSVRLVGLPLDHAIPVPL